jgi:hypothetical protein
MTIRYLVQRLFEGYFNAGMVIFGIKNNCHCERSVAIANIA